MGTEGAYGRIAAAATGTAARRWEANQSVAKMVSAKLQVLGYHLDQTNSQLPFSFPCDEKALDITVAFNLRKGVM